MSDARFPLLSDAAMSEAQRNLAGKIASGPRKTIRGPFIPLLRSPEMGDRVQQLGLYFRFETKLPKDLKELAILVTARHWSAQFEWSVHRGFAVAAGVAPEICDAIAHDEMPKDLSAEQRLVYDYARALLKEKGVGDVLFARAMQLLGDERVVDLTVCVGYYGMIGLLLNTDRTPVLPGEPTLPPLNG